MNIQPTLGDRLEKCEGPGDWEHWQRHVIPTIHSPEARIRPLRVMTRIGSMPDRGQTTTRSCAVRSTYAELSSHPTRRHRDRARSLLNSRTKSSERVFAYVEQRDN